MSKHTPEPWFYHRQGFSTVYIEARIGGGMLQEIAACGPCQDGTEQQDENARRIVACVNACAGVDTDLLEAGELDKPTMLVIQENKDLKHRCDELLAALDDITKIKWRDGLAGIDRPTDFAERESAIRALGSAMIIARSAISKATGV